MSTVVITYDGTDISTHVQFATASFESQLAGQPGTFEFTVLDRDRVLAFVTGKEVRLTIDGALYFGGPILMVTRKFGLPVDDTTDISEVHSRQWVLRGVDWNLLFDRRVTYVVANPTQPGGIPAASAALTDAQLVQLIASTYLDLGSDNVDTTTNVEAVHDPSPGSDRVQFADVGDIWRKAMIRIAAVTGAIFYLSPGPTAGTKYLHYKARETITPAWGFSDQPDGVSTFGFRELDDTEDSSNLVNDALVWGGSAAGSTGTSGQTVFGRATDAASIAALFRSQLAETHFGDYVTTARAQARANVIVFGDPGGSGGTLEDTNRGLGNPQRTMRLTWFGGTVPTPLVPGSVISVYLNVFTETLTLPVRSIRISFDSPEIVHFTAFLGVLTSDPFSLWAYIKQVADQGGTATGAGMIPTTSDGTVAANVPGTLVATTPDPSPDGSEQNFTTTDPYVAGTLRVWMNGLLQRRGYEYTELDPTTGVFRFYDAPLEGDVLWVTYSSTGV